MRMNPPGKRKRLAVAPMAGRRRKGEHAPGRRALLRARRHGATFVSVIWERTAAQRLGRAGRYRVKHRPTSATPVPSRGHWFTDRDGRVERTGGAARASSDGKVLACATSGPTVTLRAVTPPQCCDYATRPDETPLTLCNSHATARLCAPCSVPHGFVGACCKAAATGAGRS